MQDKPRSGGLTQFKPLAAEAVSSAHNIALNMHFIRPKKLAFGIRCTITVLDTLLRVVYFSQGVVEVRRPAQKF